MNYRLPDHVGFGLVDGRPVFLDLRRDRYFGLDASAAAELEILLASCSAGPAAGAPDHLLASGLLTSSADRSRIRAASCIEAIASALDRPAARARPTAIHVAIIWRRIASIRRQLARARLADQVHDLGRLKQGGSSEERSEEAFLLAAGFGAARRLVPIAPNCLPDSLALAGLLARRGLPFNLVFGVKLDPFAAHCWVQCGSWLLNDSCDTIAHFTPVFVA